MNSISQFVRPTFAEVVGAWKAALSQRHLPTELIWIFDENLCFERDATDPAKLRLGFQTQFTPPPPEADQIAYEHFCGFEAPIVFYRVGTCGDASICVLLCDTWFSSKDDRDGFIRRDEWLVAFRPGEAGNIEEISDRERWKKRVIRDRPLQDVDFCMTLRAVHETLAHGRVLTSYEHYALKLLGAWRRMVTKGQ